MIIITTEGVVSTQAITPPPKVTTDDQPTQVTTGTLERTTGEPTTAEPTTAEATTDQVTEGL